MSVHRIHVFIDRSWAHSRHYDTLASRIREKSWRMGQATLRFRDYSVPGYDPVHDASSDGQLKEAIYARIAFSHVVAIPTGMHATCSKRIRKEIDGAGEKSKPVPAFDPRGRQRASSVVSHAAGKTVGWNRTSVIDGVREPYRR